MDKLPIAKKVQSINVLVEGVVSLRTIKKDITLLNVQFRKKRILGEANPGLFLLLMLKGKT
jgi:hypothetical protein